MAGSTARMYPAGIVTTTLVGSTSGATTVNARRSREMLEATSFSLSSGGALPQIPATMLAVVTSSPRVRARRASSVRVSPVTSTGWSS